MREAGVIEPGAAPNAGFQRLAGEQPVLPFVPRSAVMKARAAEVKATKISITHFKSREGAEMSSVSPNRYFCNQCHVSQTDAKPLVGNTFKPGAGLR
mgnify:CR=1 FL=1